MKNTLIISDTHFPYHHPDTFEFLAYAAEAYGCELIKHTGDMVDNHSASYHEIEYGTMSAQEEHEKARYYLAHEQEREAIGAAGKVMTMERHTWEKRVEGLFCMLEGL